MGKKKLGGRYQLGRTLGVGAFGKVKCGTNLKTQEQVAIKILNKADIKKHGLINSVRTEVTALQLIPPHKHIVNLIEVLDSESKLYLVLELVQGGELFDKIKLEGKLNEDTAKHYFRQLISALEFMHERKICHRDLKLENLLVDQNGVLKVTDFGLSGLHTGGDDVFKTTLGSPNYVAPEVLIGKGYNGFKADIWSTGVILYVLLAGFLPFDEDNATELFKKICTADFRYPPTFSNTVIDMLNNILVVDPEKRYNIVEIKKHEWFQSKKEEDEYYKPESELMISPDIENAGPIMIETPRNSGKFGKKQSWDDTEQPPIHPSLNQTSYSYNTNDSDNEHENEYFDDEKKEKKEVKKSKSQKLPTTLTAKSNSTKKRPSLQIRLDQTYDPNKDEQKDNTKYDDVMNQYPSNSKRNQQNALFINDNASDYSDYATSDFESSPSVSPRNDMEPITMTAFDLIGIVSTQMLNNVFTRSLQEKSNSIKTYTRFVSNSSPPKILYAIQEAVHRMADCTCRVASDRYELKVIKRRGHRLIHINIQIFQTPASEYMIECRRTQGNIFRYHEFFEEFKLKYEDVIHHLDKNQTQINNKNFNKKPKQQIKFRVIDSKNNKNTKNGDDINNNNKHSRSVSDNAVIRNINNNIKMLQKLPEDKNVTTANNSNEEMKEITENILPSMQELSASQSTPTNQPQHRHYHKKNNPSNVSIKSQTSMASSSTSTNSTFIPSHHSSVTSQKSYTAEENNLTSSASPSPTPTHQNSAITTNENFPPSQQSSSIVQSQQSQSFSSTSIDDEIQSDSSHNDESGTDNNNNLKQPNRHRRSSSGNTYNISKTGHLDIPQKVSET